MYPQEALQHKVSIFLTSFILKFIPDSSNTENEDFVLNSTTLNFALVTNSVQCIIIQLVDDSILEEDETFFLETLNNSLVTSVPTTVPITIEDDDGIYICISSYKHSLYQKYIITL